MKSQQYPWSCGASALRNALYHAFDHRVREGHIRRLAGTTRDGTDEVGILTAARSLGYSALEHHSESKTASWDWLYGCLSGGKPVILCLDAYQHWATAFGVLGDRVCVFDPSNFKNNRKEGGIHTMKRPKLMHRWHNARKSILDKRRLYAIVVYR